LTLIGQKRHHLSAGRNEEVPTMVVSTTAVFQKGILRPLAPLEGIAEDALVKITIETAVPLSTEQQLAMLRAVPVAEELAATIEAGRKTTWPVEEF
jgi:hypothetical protein